MSQPVPSNPWSAFLAVWSDGIRSVLEQISGVQVQSVITREARAEAPRLAAGDSPTDFWFAIGLERNLAGHAALRIERSSALLMAQMLMEQPRRPAEFTAEHHDAIAELVRIFCGSVAVMFKALLGEEIPVRLLDMARPAWQPAAAGLVELSLEDGTSIRAHVFTDGMLAKALQQSTLGRPLASTTRSQHAADSTTNRREERNALPALGVLRDLGLRARLSFGEHVMPLSDVMGCVPGSVIESDRQTEMPVELWVEGVLAGRGDMVTVDGSYGVCIRELCNPQSLRSYVQRGTVLKD